MHKVSTFKRLYINKGKFWTAAEGISKELVKHCLTMEIHSENTSLATLSSCQHHVV